MRRLHRPIVRVWPVAAVVALMCGVCATDAGAEPLAVQPVAACASASAATAVPAGIPVLDWSENVGYDARGNLWVSRIYRNEVQRYDSAGRLTATVPVEFPGAVRLGPDGLLYVVYGDSPTSVIQPGGVVRFDPDDPRPTVFASGFTMPNGAAFDARGNLYVASLAGVVRIRPDGSIDNDWTSRAKYSGANGIVVRGNSIYVTLNGNPLGRVVRLALDDPSNQTVVADLTSVLPGFPDFADDFLIDDAGVLYVTTLTGQLVRVDPDTGATCAVLTGEPMTSVVAPGRPDELLAGTESGAIVRIRLPH